MTRHQYYYMPKQGKPGRPISQTTNKQLDNTITQCDNQEVVSQIENNHKDPDLCYGYHTMTTELQIQGYIINHKKVYRLMKTNDLLQRPNKPTKKQYATYRIVIPDQPLKVLEMDIKFVWVENKKKHAYVLSIIDTFTRVILDWEVGFSITQKEVKCLWESIITNHLQKHDMLQKAIDIEVRNDNDPRFSSKLIQGFFKENYLNQVFTHPYTPQENGHIESFHSIMSKSLNPSYWNLEALKTRLIIFYEKYNNVRLHGAIARLPPNIFWEQWNKGHIDRQVKEGKKVRFKLTVPYYSLSGNETQRSILHKLRAPRWGE